MIEEFQAKFDTNKQETKKNNLNLLWNLQYPEDGEIHKIISNKARLEILKYNNDLEPWEYGHNHKVFRVSDLEREFDVKFNNESSIENFLNEVKEDGDFGFTLLSYDFIDYNGEKYFVIFDIGD